MKNKILQMIRDSKPYAFFRKVRYALHLIPAWHWFKGFVRHYFGGLYDRTDRHHLFLLAGGLAFSLFVCIVPMTLIIFWLLGKFLNSVEVEQQIITLIDTIIPYDTYAQFVKDIIFVARIAEVMEKNLKFGKLFLNQVATDFSEYFLDRKRIFMEENLPEYKFFDRVSIYDDYGDRIQEIFFFLTESK